MTDLMRVFEVTACPETGQVIDDLGDDGEDQAVWMRWVLPVVVYLPYGTPPQVVEAVEEHLEWIRLHEPGWSQLDVVIDFDDHLWVDRADEVAGPGLRAWIQQIMGEAA